MATMAAEDSSCGAFGAGRGRVGVSDGGVVIGVGAVARGAGARGDGWVSVAGACAAGEVEGAVPGREIIFMATAATAKRITAKRSIQRVLRIALFMIENWSAEKEKSNRLVAGHRLQEWHWPKQDEWPRLEIWLARSLSLHHHQPQWEAVGMLCAMRGFLRVFLAEIFVLICPG